MDVYVYKKTRRIFTQLVITTNYYTQISWGKIKFVI